MSIKLNGQYFRITRKLEVTDSSELSVLVNKLVGDGFDVKIVDGKGILNLRKVMHWLYYGLIRVLHPNGGWEYAEIKIINSGVELSLVYKWVTPILFSSLVALLVVLSAIFILQADLKIGLFFGWCYLTITLTLILAVVGIVYIFLVSRKIRKSIA